jgi:chorismate dehydratase
MIRLGHIEYSNCFPVHALLVAGEPPASVEIVSGTPAQLNVALASGAIDVAPASSIEYARHSDTYRLLPDFVIASDGPVGSILFESTRSIEDLADRSIALPTASATSVVLLKILLHFKYRIGARFHWFDQDSGTDPLEGGSDAALWIGDVALRRATPAGHHVYDLGGPQLTRRRAAHVGGVAARVSRLLPPQCEAARRVVVAAFQLGTRATARLLAVPEVFVR